MNRSELVDVEGACPTLTTKAARDALLSVVPHADAALGVVSWDDTTDDEGDPIIYWSAPVYARDIDGVPIENDRLGYVEMSEHEGEPRLTWERQ
jgi:hypothetical protein